MKSTKERITEQEIMKIKNRTELFLDALKLGLPCAARFHSEVLTDMLDKIINREPGWRNHVETDALVSQSTFAANKTVRW